MRRRWVILEYLYAVYIITNLKLTMSSDLVDNSQSFHKVNADFVVWLLQVTYLLQKGHQICHTTLFILYNFNRNITVSKI